MKQMNYEAYWCGSSVDFDELKGCIISEVKGLEEGSDEVIFELSDGRQFKLYHEQDCCEGVTIYDVCGDVNDLIGAEIVHFEERTNEDENAPPYEYCESYTWTFYDIQTTKGCVNIRWLGESNGYYSESVDSQWGK